MAYFLHRRFLKYGKASITDVIEVSMDAIKLSSPIIKIIKKNSIDHKGDAFRVETA